MSQGDEEQELDPDRVPRPLRSTLEPEREHVMAELQEAFTRGVVDLDEFDERMEMARTARNQSELAVLVEDVPGASLPAVLDDSGASSRSSALAVPQDTRPMVLRAIFGGVEKEGEWTPPARIDASAIFGGVELDFRRANLAPGTVVEVVCNAIFGGVEIEVPPWVRVEMQGSGFFGGFSKKKGKRSDPDDDAPVIRVTGRAIFGGVEVKVKKDKRRKKRSGRRRLK